MTVAEAAHRLGMSPSWFKEFAEAENITVERRGRRPGVLWADVEAYVARSRITRISHTLLREVEQGVVLPGVGLMDEVRSRFDWSDHDLADALGVSWTWLSRWGVQGAPRRHIGRLEVLLAAQPGDVPPPRRKRWSERNEEP